MNKPKIIFVIGGVVSGLGKGITCASIAALLKSAKIKISVQKIDPYLNVDPGTINPIEHGEIFVTADGTETDLDLGHYERIADVITTKNSNFTAGQVYQTVIKNERRGVYQGKTVQTNPHVTTQIKKFIFSQGPAQVLFCELGGVVGDIESLPFIEAIRQLKFEMGRDQVMIIGVGLLTFLSSTMELKTKPMQNSIRKFLELGIQPDLWVIRSDQAPTQEVCNKISLYSGLTLEKIFFALTQVSIYDMPTVLYQQGIHKVIFQQLGLQLSRCNLTDWSRFLTNVHQKFKHSVEVALVGKYVKLHDSYLSISEALKAAAVKNQVNLKIRWISSERTQSVTQTKQLLGKVDGILVPGGFGERGIEGMIKTVSYARSKKIPFFGICLGMQVAVIEIARSLAGLEDANSQEFNPQTKNPIFCLTNKDHQPVLLGGTLRRGNYPVSLQTNTLIFKLYKGQSLIYERHRHRYEFNNRYKLLLEQQGVIFSGFYRASNLVETIELTNHPFFIGCQYHPEFASRPIRPHPLFTGFIQSVKKQVLQRSTGSSVKSR